MTILIAATFAIAGCMQQESTEMGSSVELEQVSNLDPSEGDEQDTLLEVSLGGASRAERFLGSYDQIERLALDVVRNYGNKQVESDLVLTQEGTIWKGTVPNLIVGFDYTITGHAYRPYDNVSDNWTTGKVAEAHSNGNKWLEIFQGQVQHPVVEGTNTLSLRLAPILDDRDLSVPRITRIQRPFQLGTNETSSIEVRVDTVGSGSDDDLSWRFRTVDNQSLPVNDVSRGTFSPDSGDNLSHTSGIYPYITSDYTAPDNSSPCFDDGTEQGQCPQKLQVRVSNLQEIGVSAHFTVYVTDNETAVTTVDNNPAITSISAERVGPNQLQWTIEVSDDDPFDSLDVHWDYLFGEPRNFNDNSTDNLTNNTGRMQTVMEYSDTDDGMLLVTVCETDEGEGACQYQNESSTSVEYMLIPHAFPEIVTCDDTGCELPSRIAGTRLSPKKWYSCSVDDNTSRYELQTWSLTFKDFEYTREGFAAGATDCNGSPEWISKVSGGAQQNSASAFVYPTVDFIDAQTGDNVSVYEVKLNVGSNTRTLFDSSMITSYNDDKTCGYNANDWGDNVTLDVSGCSAVNPEVTVGDNLSFIFYQDNNTMRFGNDGDSGTYPRDLECITFSNDSSNPGDDYLCNIIPPPPPGDGVFVVQGHQQVSRSWDNITTWDNATLNTSFYTSGICYGNGTFVVVGDDNNGPFPIIATSRDHAASFDNVSSSNIHSDLSHSFYDCEFGNGVFIAAGTSQTGRSVDNGSSWTRVDTDHAYDVAFGNNVFAKVSNSGSIKISTDNGLTFSNAASSPATKSLFGITFGDNVFVAVGDNGEIVRSIDYGNNWIHSSSTPNDQRLWSVGYGNGVFIATGTGIILRSTNNGDTWTAIASPNTGRLNSVAYGDGTFLITVGGKTLKSTDLGLTWTEGIRTHSSSGENKAIYVDRDDL